MHECEYHKSIADMENSNVAQSHAMKRGIWGKLSQKIKLNNLIDIEHKVQFVNATKKEGKK
jgi:hypothetical protein